MFENIAGLEFVEAETTVTTTQLESLMELAKNRIGERHGLQQWTNFNIKLLPSLGEKFVQVYPKDEPARPQNLMHSLWAIALMSLQEQQYTTQALLNAVTATSMNKACRIDTKPEAWNKSTLFILNHLQQIGMLTVTVREWEGKKQNILVLSSDWTRANCSDFIERARETTSIVCKPLDAPAPKWMGGKVQDATKLKLVSSKSDTIASTTVGHLALQALNKLQRVGFEVAPDFKDEIFELLDKETEENKRAGLLELLTLEGAKYFPVTGDYRFRLYYRGGVVHPQAQKTVRQFLNFSEGETVNRLDAIEDLEIALQDRENPVQRRELERLQSCTSERVQCSVIVHKDGVSNGLQHQAMLLKSNKLAKLTKLIESDLEEIYKYITELLIKRGYKVTRKFIKVIVMVASYGATKGTQIQRLAEKLPMEQAKQVYEIINEELPELKIFVNLISSRLRSAGLTVKLSTPDGFELTYKKADRSKETILAGAFSAIIGSDYEEDKAATIRSCSPNLIHMIDSYHLRQVILDWTGNICTIHDSFGVVAGRGRELQECILRTFKETHKIDWFARFTHDNNLPKISIEGDLEMDDVQNREMFC